MALLSRGEVLQLAGGAKRDWAVCGWEQKLGISKDASNGEIKKAYRKMAMSHHPDKGGDEDEVPLLSKLQPERDISLTCCRRKHCIRSMAMFSPGRAQRLELLPPALCRLAARCE